MAGAGGLRAISDKQRPSTVVTLSATLQRYGVNTFTFGLVLFLLPLFTLTGSKSTEGPLLLLALASLLAGCAVTAAGLLMMLVGFVFSKGPHIALKRWLIYRRISRLPYEVRCVLALAAASRGGRVALPTDLPEAQQLLQDGYLEVALCRGPASIFRLRPDLVVTLRFGVPIGNPPRLRTKPRTWLADAEDVARAHLIRNLPPFRLSAGPVAATKAADAWLTSRLPWRLTPSHSLVDRITCGRPVVMDRRTWDALPERPLPDRLNIVVTRSERAQEWIMMDGGEVAETLDEALLLAQGEIAGSEIDVVHVIGGPALLRSALKDCDLIDLTERADDEAPPPTPFGPPDWEEISRENLPAKAGDPPVLRRVLSRSRKVPTAPDRLSIS
ncbi:MAG: dihydrofolate reductase [Alphaproteobacteria bacterium]|nr:dihydrofolate reductase [Alphaproteobacteria bacterium]MBU1515430.1 dihydrofolate reductase [Alphaproteobacteria bacterium]MBU2095428.1 dihydrofolate reductase [Alphaproteobacteria bacterium]MBU2150670.1 dihydrofolate reductase [Alphaproteobacteria bacterium]MBU2306934.1 dihydrofolate reductase [Alphaproteobacteria bacterium]